MAKLIKPAWQRWGRKVFVPCLAVAMLGLFVGTAQAVHDARVFQLDRNALTSLQSTPPASHDWDQVCATRAVPAISSCSTYGNDGANAGTFDTDVVGAGDNIFTGAQPGGNSKDPDVISGWRHTLGSVPDKDDLNHAYSAQYVNVVGGPDAGHTLLYFGADRFGVSGDSQLGFWFFRTRVGENPIPAGSNVGTFSGAHTARVVNPATGAVISHGDLLVLSDFLKGGASPTVRVFEWVGSGGSAGSLDLIAGTTLTPADCLGNPNQNPPVPPVGLGDPFCAVVNTGDETAPWPYTPKAGTSGIFPAGAFFEGGIDLTAIGVGNECFSSFLAETRSSQSPTATLKDYVLSGFASCSATMDTTPSKTSFEIGGTLHDSATITVHGPGTPAGPTGSVDFFVCGTPATSCDATGTSLGSTNLSTATVSGNDYTVQSPDFTPTSAGTYCFFARWGGDVNYPDGASHDGTNECFTVTPRQPTILTTQTTGPVSIGSSISDTATLGNTANKPNGNPAGGTITFTAYGPQADPKNPVCTAQTLAYTSVAYAVSGNNTYPTATQAAASFIPTSAGTYNWVATYSGDPPNTLGVSSGCPDEASVITPLQPTISTSQTAGPVPLGSPISDTATLGNTANKPNGNPAGGTITFTAYGPQADPNNPVCSPATLVYTSAAYAVSGNGTYPTATQAPASFTPTAAEGAGTYNWVATYSGDPPNTLGVTSNCADEASVVISLQPTISTTQSWVPNDSATVTVGSGAGNLIGHIRFQMFVNNTGCSTQISAAAYDSGDINIDNGTPNSGTAGTTKTVTTNNTTAYNTNGANGTNTFSWLVTYTNTNPGQKSVTSSCNTENSTLTVNGNG